MDLIQKKHIEFEANKIFEANGTIAESNWDIAKENLRIFPSAAFGQLAMAQDGTYGQFLNNSFGIVVKKAGGVGLSPGIWIYGCREYFERAWLEGRYESGVPYGTGITIIDSSHFFYSLNGFYNEDRGCTYRVAEFIRYLEVCKLDLTHLTKFEHDDRGLMKIMPSDFWSQQSMRFSLFSLLIRSGFKFNRNCNDPNINECLTYGSTISRNNRAVLIQQSNNAIYRFLSGKHNFTGLHNWKTARTNWIDTLGNVANHDSLLI